MCRGANKTDGPNKKINSTRNNNRNPSMRPRQRSPRPPPARDQVAQLKDLAELRSQGILTDAEFEAQKAKILAS